MGSNGLEPMTFPIASGRFIQSSMVGATSITNLRVVVGYKYKGVYHQMSYGWRIQVHTSQIMDGNCQRYIKTVHGEKFEAYRTV